jgi:hypothetical protein
MTTGTTHAAYSILYSASMDRELEHRLLNFLHQRSVPGGDGVRLDACGGVVAVSGEFPTRYAKWLYIECCRRVAGVIKVIDKTKVEPAISELPVTLRLTAEPMSRRRNRRHMSARPRGYIGVSDRATQRTVAASQPPRLLAAA